MTVTADDVAARMGRSLTATEAARVAPLDVEATALVESYAGVTVESIGGDARLLERVRVVVARMVARALQVPADLAGVQQWSETLSAYSQSRQYADGYGDGGVWLTDSDRLLLDAVFAPGGRGSGMVSVALATDRTP